MQPGRRSEVQGRRREGPLASLRSDLRGQSCRCFRGQISKLGSQALVRPMWASLRNLATRVTLQDLEGEGRRSCGHALGYTPNLKRTHLGGGGCLFAAPSRSGWKGAREGPRPDPQPRLPHLLPRQHRRSAPGHLLHEGGGPGRGAEVVGGDGQELGDAELLGHGERGPGAPKWPELGVRGTSQRRAGLVSELPGSLRRLRTPRPSAPPRPAPRQASPGPAASLLASAESVAGPSQQL